MNTSTVWEIEYFRTHRIVWQSFAKIGPGTSKNRWWEKDKTTMWANAQLRDGCPAEYMWRPCSPIFCRATITLDIGPHFYFKFIICTFTCISLSALSRRIVFVVVSDDVSAELAADEEQADERRRLRRSLQDGGQFL